MMRATSSVQITITGAQHVRQHVAGDDRVVRTERAGRLDELAFSQPEAQPRTTRA